MKQSTIDTHLRPVWPVGFVPRKTENAEDGMITVLCEEGDYKLMFNPNNADEVEAAKASFKSLKTKGWLAFKVSKTDDNKPGEQITEFDSKAGKILMAPPMAGG